MVDREKFKIEFAARLNKACDDASIRKHGRASDIESALGGKGIAPSQTAIGKWLNGQSMPEPHNLRPLAEWLGVRAEWLEYGTGQQKAANESNNIAATAILSMKGKTTKRSSAILDRLEKAAAEGSLTDDDLAAIEGIAKRLELANKNKS